MKTCPTWIVALVLVLLDCPLGDVTANQPPSVQILRPPYPAQNFNQPAYAAAGEVILIKVAASDPDGSIALVRLFANELLIAEWSDPPYAMVWDPFEQKPPNLDPFFDDDCYPVWNLTAVAIDDSGQSSTSAAVSVRGSCTAPSSSVIEFTFPTDGALFAVGEPFQIAAELQISNLIPNQNLYEIWAGTHLVGSLAPDEIRIDPHLFHVAGLEEGEYRIRVTHSNYYFVEHLTPPVTVRVIPLGLDAPVLTPEGRLDLEGLTSFPGQAVILESSTNLRDWTELESIIHTANRFSMTTQLASPPDAQQFYRLIIPGQEDINQPP